MKARPLTAALAQRLAFKFWYRVDRSGECWIWRGTLDVQGYGTIEDRVDGRRTVKAHRLSWAIANGSISPGMLVCHHCDNPPCVRPDHLFIGTDADNVADMVKKGRARRLIGGACRAAFGERHGYAKLTWVEVRSARAEHRAGGISIGALARHYGVSQPSMSLLIRGKTWTHEPGEPWKPSHTTVVRKRNQASSKENS